MTELADVRAALKEAETTLRAALNQHAVAIVKPVASQQDLDMLIADIRKFTVDTAAAVNALSPDMPVVEPSKGPFPFIPPGSPAAIPPAVPDPGKPA